MTHLMLSPQTMRLMVDLRRLLQRDHGMDIDIDDDYALENLLDAARMAKDNHAEQLAYAICDTLEASRQDSGTQIKKLRQRVSPHFRTPLNERLGGPQRARMYRGNPLPDSEDASDDESDGVISAEPPTPDDNSQYIIYRGQRVLRNA